MRPGIINTGFPRINIGLIVIILVVIVHAVLSLIIISNNNREVTKMINVINPYVESLDQFNLMVTESKMYTTNWVYLQVEEDDKAELKQIHKEKYPRLRDKLLSQVKAIGAEEENRVREIFREFEALMSVQQLIMVKLATFDDYDIPVKKFQAEGMIESQIIPASDSLRTRLASLIADSRQRAEASKNEVISSSNSLRNSVMGVSAALFGAVILSVVFISRSVRNPVMRMREIIRKMARGEIPEDRLEVTKDVIGEMTSSVNILSESFDKTSTFAGEIEKGNFSAEFERLSENDQLGNALIKMRMALKAYSEDMEFQVETRTRQLMEKSLKLEIAYGEIRDSIQYAKHIQEAILPSKELIFGVFKQSFIFYKPKDIVSGDFYWFAQRGDEVIVAVVDCTGHGVPGALMTVIGSSLLSEVVNIMGVMSPSMILKTLDKKVIESLKQQGNTSNNDGMDIAMFRYNLKTREMSYSGAKRSLYLFRKGEFREFKGDKLPIGSTQYGENKSFKEHVLTIQPSDVVYMFSDGYQDQFGGEAGKKFMLKRMKDMLVEIHNMKMEDQALVIERENVNWTGNAEQTDDILVLGIRF